MHRVLAKYNLMNLLAPDSWRLASAPPPLRGGLGASGLAQRGWCIEPDAQHAPSVGAAPAGVAAVAAHAIKARRAMTGLF